MNKELGFYTSAEIELARGECVIEYVQKHDGYAQGMVDGGGAVSLD